MMTALCGDGDSLRIIEPELDPKAPPEVSAVVSLPDDRLMYLFVVSLKPQIPIPPSA